MEHVPNIPDRGKTWFTSDLHLGHRRILEHCNRPFETIEEHDEALLQGIHDTVGENDVLYVLGDLSLTSVRKYRTRLAKLPGTRYFVCGNHDPAWHGFRGSNQKSRDPKRYKAAGFREVNIGEPGKEWILSYEALGWEGVAQVALSHFPTEPVSAELRAVGLSSATGQISAKDRYEYYRPKYTGIPILCGHIHDAWKVNKLNVNVGVDVWDYKPVSAEQLWELVKDMQVEQKWPNRRF